MGEGLWSAPDDMASCRQAVERSVLLARLIKPLAQACTVTSIIGQVRYTHVPSIMATL